ncbi:hypothetical protein KC316_g17339, partial [Hortaea werneckii]
QAKTSGTPVREQHELRQKLREAEGRAATLQNRVETLEYKLESAQQVKGSSTPDRERKELKQKLVGAESKVARLQEEVESLEADLAFAQQEKTIADERMDLHDNLKQAKIEAEELQIQLQERDRKIAVSARKEGDLRRQLSEARQEVEDCQIHISELEARTQAGTGKERELRNQLKELRDARIQIEELEMQLGDRKGSSSGHARREVELKTQLRETKAELESLVLESEEKDEQIQTLSKKERDLRERIKRGRSSNDTVNLEMQEMLDSADQELQDLHSQLQQRDSKLLASRRREQELQQKLQGLQKAIASDQTLHEKQYSGQLSATQKQHESELKGLAKQIQFLRAKCQREETFRADLVYTKKWFLMQVEMYNKCNKADLRLLEEMGITPDVSFRERKPSVKTVGLMVIAGLRMQRMQQAWQGNKKLQEQLVKKLEGMRRRQGKGSAALR